MHVHITNFKRHSFHPTSSPKCLTLRDAVFRRRGHLLVREFPGIFSSDPAQAVVCGVGDTFRVPGELYIPSLNRGFGFFGELKSLAPGMEFFGRQHDRLPWENL